MLSGFNIYASMPANQPCPTHKHKTSMVSNIQTPHVSGARQNISVHLMFIWLVISQQKYALDMLQEACLFDYIITPVDPNVKLPLKHGESLVDPQR